MKNKQTEVDRSAIMRSVRSKDTEPEMAVRRFVHRLGYRFRLHNKSLPGTPDLVFTRLRKIIFVHGCFWHGHKGCKYYVVPKTRTEWWMNKINGNIENDKKAIKALKKEGWKIITLWECDLKPNNIVTTLSAVVKKIA